MIANQTVSLGEDRRETETSELVGAGTMVNKHDVLAGTDHLVFQIDATEVCSVHGRNSLCTRWASASGIPTLLLSYEMPFSMVSNCDASRANHRNCDVTGRPIRRPLP